MMNKIEKLLDLCIKIAETHLDAAAEKKTHPPLSFPTESPMASATNEEKATAAAEIKKTRRPRTPKEAPFKGEGTEGLEDQLGGIEETPKELTEDESRTKMEEVTKQFVSLCKNDTPEDGKTRAIALMRNVFKVQKLGELTHQQRIEWIAEMEKGILEHK